MNTAVVKDFRKRLENLEKDYRKLTSKKNKILKKNYNGIYYRYKNPVITAWQVPLTWRYDLKPETNPYLMQRIGVNSAFNRGAINIDRKYLLIVSSEVWDRKSFFAVAESPNGIDNFRFWVRLPHFILHYGQQRNLVLHPEFMNGKHAFYTRPQDGFIEVEAGEGIGWTFVEDIIHAEAHDEIIIDQKIYHTIKELNNGLGPAPIKTEKGRQHLAHGLRSCASELQYVLYLFMTDLADPSKVINFPFGYLWRRRAKKELMIFQMFCSQMDG